MNYHSAQETDFEWILGFVEDTFSIDSNRRKAEEIEWLAEMARGRTAPKSAHSVH